MVDPIWAPSQNKAATKLLENQVLILSDLCDLASSLVVSTLPVLEALPMSTAHHSTLGVGRPAAPQVSVAGSPGAATRLAGCSRMEGGELSGSGGRWVSGGGGRRCCPWPWPRPS